MADEISLKVTYVGNSLTLVASFLLIVGLVAVPSLRQTISSRIVLWIAVSDLLWWTAALIQVAANSCWIYPIDLFFSASSSAWTSIMAVQLVLVHFGYRPKHTWEYLYFPAALLFSLALSVPVGLISGGYVSSGTTGYCVAKNSAHEHVFPIAVVIEVAFTFTICFVSFLLLQCTSRPKAGTIKINDDAPSEFSVEKKNSLSNSRYLWVYIMCWTPRLLHEMMNLAGTTPPPWLDVVAQVFLTTIGFWNAIVYGTMPPEFQFQRLWLYVLRGLWRVGQRIMPEETWKDQQQKLLQESLNFGYGSSTPLIKETSALIAKLTTSSFAIPHQKLVFIKKIGSGSSGVIYLARYHGSDVAVKELHQSSTSEEAVEEFRKEASLLSNLHHPFVARFLGISYSPPDKLFLVGEYYPHVLNKVLEGEKPSKLLRKAIILEIAQAMEFLHSRNVSHRDLKPENILLDSEMHVKVTDFGLSKEVTKNLTLTLSQTGMIGTPIYMAPELFRDRSSYNSTKVDVYAYGIVFWEVLTHSRAYSGERNFTLFQLINAIESGMRPPIPDTWNSIYQHLAAASLDANPKRRPEFAQIVLVLEGKANKRDNDENVEKGKEKEKEEDEIPTSLQ